MFRPPWLRPQAGQVRIWLLPAFVWILSGDPLHSDTVTYGLDKVGNREARISSVLSVPSVVNPVFNPRDQLSTDTYDANGNTLASPSLPYSLTPSSPALDEHHFDAARQRGTSYYSALEIVGSGTLAMHVERIAAHQTTGHGVSRGGAISQASAPQQFIEQSVPNPPTPG